MVKQKRLEIMATIESTTNLVDKTNKNSLATDQVEDSFFQVNESSSKLAHKDDEEKVVNNINDSKIYKKDSKSNSLTNSPILSSSDLDTDNEEKTPRLRENSGLTLKNGTNSVQHRSLSPRPTSALKSVCFRDNLNPASAYNNNSNNDTINSTSSLSRGNVIYLKQPDQTLINTTAAATSPTKTQNPFLNQISQTPNTSETFDYTGNEFEKPIKNTIGNSNAPNTSRNLKIEEQLENINKNEEETKLIGDSSKE